MTQIKEKMLKSLWSVFISSILKLFSSQNENVRSVFIDFECRRETVFVVVLGIFIDCDSWNLPIGLTPSESQNVK